MDAIEELYQRAVRRLSAADRLRLATMILNDIQPQSMVDHSDAWGEDDYRDFNRANWTRRTSDEDPTGGEGS